MINFEKISYSSEDKLLMDNSFIASLDVAVMFHILQEIIKTLHEKIIWEINLYFTTMQYWKLTH